MITRARALTLGAADPRARFGELFHHVPCSDSGGGRSLGPMPKDSKAAILSALDRWKTPCLDGVMLAEPSWFDAGEQPGPKLRSLGGSDAGGKR